MPIKPTFSESGSGPDTGHLVRPEKKLKTQDIAPSASTEDAKENTYQRYGKGKKVKQQVEDNFEEGIERLKNWPLRKMPGSLSDSKTLPAFHPKSSEQVSKNLEANWQTIEERKIKEAKQEPLFGSAVQKYLDMIFRD